MLLLFIAFVSVALATETVMTDIDNTALFKPVERPTQEVNGTEAETRTRRPIVTLKPRPTTSRPQIALNNGTNLVDMSLCNAGSTICVPPVGNRTFLCLFLCISLLFQGDFSRNCSCMLFANKYHQNMTLTPPKNVQSARVQDFAELSGNISTVSFPTFCLFSSQETS